MKIFDMHIAIWCHKDDIVHVTRNKYPLKTWQTLIEKMLHVSPKTVPYFKIRYDIEDIAQNDKIKENNAQIIPSVIHM